MAHSDLHSIEALTLLSLGELDVNMSSRILCATSGGADSTALASILSERCRAGQFRTLGIVHINHSLRGIESDEDELFVKQFAGKLGAEFFSSKVDTHALAAEKKLSIEEAARVLRYQEMIRIAREKNFDVIATAHTANDNLETVLHNMVRGTGIAGLRGIPPRRPLTEEIEVIRPLLDIERSDLIQYLKDKQLDYRDDSSNSSLEFLRNRLRHLVVPALEQAFEGRNIYDGFRRTIRIVSEFADRQDEQTTVLVKHSSRKLPPTYFKRDVVAYDVFMLYPLDQTSMRSFVMTAIRRKWKDLTAFSLDSTQTMLLVEFIRDETKQEYWMTDELVLRRETYTGKVQWTFEDEMRRLPRFIEENPEEFEDLRDTFFRADDDADDDDNDSDSETEMDDESELIVFERVSPAPPTLEIPFEPGSQIETEIGILTAELCPKNQVTFVAGNAYFDWEVFQHASLRLRYWKEGDRIYPFGMKGQSKLVSDILNEADVPSYLKKRCLVCVFQNEPDHLVWVPGLRAADIARVSAKTETVLVLSRKVSE